jgi:DNA mismatch endonuclease (patch repair protein)
MRQVRSANTTPEKKVRSLLHRLGFRFRLHRQDLPGKPDIVLPKHASVVFVHGCFWHRHPGCPRATTPATHQDYWLPKFKRTVERDKRNQIELRRLGWRVAVVWECELRNLDRLAKRLTIAIAGAPIPYSKNVSAVQMAAEPHAPYGNRENKTVSADTD